MVLARVRSSGMKTLWRRTVISCWSSRLQHRGCGRLDLEAKSRWPADRRMSTQTATTTTQLLEEASTQVHATHENRQRSGDIDEIRLTEVSNIHLLSASVGDGNMVEKRD